MPRTRLGLYHARIVDTSSHHHGKQASRNSQSNLLTFTSGTSFTVLVKVHDNVVDVPDVVDIVVCKER